MTVKLRKGIAVTTTEYGGVLLDEKDGSYWQLNDTSIIVVETLAAGRTPRPPSSGSSPSSTSSVRRRRRTSPS